MKRSVLSRLSRFLRPYALRLVGTACLLLLANLAALSAPLLSGQALDAVGIRAGGVDFPAVIRNCAGMLGCYALAALFQYIVSASLIRIGQEVSHDLRTAAFDRMSDLPVKYFDKHPAGDLISRISYDVDTVNAMISTDLLQLCTSFLTVAGSFVMLLLISVRLSWIFFLTVPLSAFLTRFQMRRLHPLYRQRSKELGALNGFAEERIGCRQAIRVYGVEAEDLRQFTAYNRSASEAYYKADWASAALGPSVNFINNVSLAAISAFGTLLYLGQALTLGNLSSFLLYSRKFSGPIREAANLLSDLQSSVAAAERVLDLLDEPPEPEDVPGAAAPENLKGEVVFDHVTFGYAPAQPVLQDFSARIPAGSMVAVVGPTGAGKTTLVSLLLRFYAPQQGVITIDGTPIEAYSRDGLRRSLGLVMQDTWLFGGTIADNIAYGTNGASREDIIAAAKAAHIHRFISSLPDGYDTVLTDGGAGISKGQRQLLAIARCFLTGADIIILDEATSNVDTETEREIGLAVDRLRAGRTFFVIAHRLDTIRNADHILVMGNGGVAEQGTHEELMAANGIYADMLRASGM